MDYVKVGRLEEFADTNYKAYAVLAKRVGVFREPDGTFYAIELLCKHAGADLSFGEFTADTVTCPRHGWKYDLKSGECLNQPGTLPLRRHAVKVEGEDILMAVFPDDPYA